jgi:ferredoxin-NADP reductase
MDDRNYSLDIKHNASDKLFLEFCTARKNEPDKVCGPADMLDSVVKILKSLGIKANNIHYEKFSI